MESRMGRPDRPVGEQEVSPLGVPAGEVVLVGLVGIYLYIVYVRTSFSKSLGEDASMRVWKSVLRYVPVTGSNALKRPLSARARSSITAARDASASKVQNVSWGGPVM